MKSRHIFVRGSNSREDCELWLSTAGTHIVLRQDVNLHMLPVDKIHQLIVAIEELKLSPGKSVTPRKKAK